MLQWNEKRNHRHNAQTWAAPGGARGDGGETLMQKRQGRRLPARARIVAAGITLLALAGCDGAGSGIGAQSVAVLHERVAAVRTAADSDNRAAAIAAVDAFRAEVRGLVDAGTLSESQAAALLTHADAIADGVFTEVVEPTPTPTPSTTPTPTPESTPAASPGQVQMLREETAERFTALLRERLSAYVEQQIAERKAAEKAEREKDRRGDRDKDRRDGGSDEN